MIAGKDAAIVQNGIELFEDHFVDQRALARSRRSRNANELTQRNAHVDTLQIVMPGAGNGEPLAVELPPFFGDSNRAFTAKVLAGEGSLRAKNLPERSVLDNLAAVDSRSRP